MYYKIKNGDLYIVKKRLEEKASRATVIFKAAVFFAVVAMAIVVGMLCLP